MRAGKDKGERKMANLIVTAHGEWGSTRRLSNEVINATLASRTHQINVSLNIDGEYRITIGLTGGEPIKKICGNVTDIDKT